MKSILVSLIVFFCIYSGVQAQEISKYDLERRAENHFERQRYLKATGDYEILYNMYPKDAKYAYYLGRSYLHSNRYLGRATDLLKFSARRNYGDDAYFYLGQAHHLNYNFEDAALAFITFQKQASAKVLKKFDVDYWISVTANAKQSVEVVQNLNIESLHAIPSNAIESAFKDIKHGKYIYVPDQFRSKSDKEMDYLSHMYLPNDIGVGDYLYFSSQSKNGKQGAEIYRSQRISEEDYSVPELLGEKINTAYDEAYPYFDKTSSTLYFSSKGHNTSGGYDILKSQYNAETKSWATPEKLDFPINSVHDDFLFTSCGSDNENVMFLTNRNCTPMELEAYILQMPSPGDYVSTTGRDDVVTFALLSPSSIVIAAPILGDINGNLEKPGEKVMAENRTNLSPKEKYAMILEEALEMQVQSDSLGSIAKDLRGKARVETNYQTKQELVASITSLDKESKRLQYEADVKFKQASQIRKDDVQEQLANNNTNLTPTSTSEGITAYKHNTGSHNIKATSVDTKKNYNEGFTAAKKAGEEFASSFDIMNSSPYSQNNPIPVASIPAGLVYSIQLGAYANNIPENTFGGLAPVSKEQASASTKYYVGVFKSIGEARSALDKVKSYGYPDAFLVSYHKKSKISVQEAREIEFANR